uniref:hypothetical protein n=1 Tax=Escherichia coli TaxID=562 RepID=UPI001BC8357C
RKSDRSVYRKTHVLLIGCTTKIIRGSENRNNIIKAKFIFFICKLLMGFVIESLFVMGFDIAVMLPTY